MRAPTENPTRIAPMNKKAEACRLAQADSYFESANQALFEHARKISPFMGRSTTNGATMASLRSPATNVVVFQWPWGV